MGIVKLERTSQPLNAECPNERTLSGSEIFVSEVQPRNAFLPIKVTPLGIVMLVRTEQSQNAPSPIEETFPSKVMIPLPVALSHSFDVIFAY